MKKLIFVLLITFTFTSTAFAHSGRTDRCGGHNDRKRGGYHIHNQVKYCACYPEDAMCKGSKDDMRKDKPGKQKGK